MTANRVCYTLDSTLESVDQMEQNVTRWASDAGFGDDQVFQISMAVREGMVNAVLHGNRYDPQKKVFVKLERAPSGLSVTIRDQGEGLDPARIPDPLAPENLLKQSGRGIFLMRSFMDDVRINANSSGTEVIMIKNFGGSAAEPKEKAQ